MTEATNDVGNNRQLYIIICSLFKVKRKIFNDEHKWPDDVEVEQIV